MDRILTNFYRCTINTICHWDYPDWQHHGLVRQMHRPRPQSSAEGGQINTAHHQDWAASHPSRPRLQQEEGTADPLWPQPSQPVFSRSYHLAGGTGASRPETSSFRDSFYPQAIRLLNCWCWHLHPHTYHTHILSQPNGIHPDTLGMFRRRITTVYIVHRNFNLYQYCIAYQFCLTS